MTREEAEDYVWEVHNTYFVQHPSAQTYPRHALYALLIDLLPTPKEREELYAALSIETCIECLTKAGIDPDTFCVWCAVLDIVFKETHDA